MGNDREMPDASSCGEDSLPMTSAAVLGVLDRLGIDYTLHHHPPLRTVADSQHLRGAMAGTHIKNLYLRDNKKKNFLIVAAEDRVIDLKTLAEALGSKRLSFGSAERLMEFLGVRPGAVSPLALINDTDFSPRQKNTKTAVSPLALINDTDFSPRQKNTKTAVSPLALINDTANGADAARQADTANGADAANGVDAANGADTAHRVQLVIDPAITQAEQVNMHPLVNDKTVTLTQAGLRQFLTHTGHWASRIEGGVQ